MKKVVLALGMTLAMASAALGASSTGVEPSPGDQSMIKDPGGFYQGSQVAPDLGSDTNSKFDANGTLNDTSDDVQTNDPDNWIGNANATGVGAEGTNKDQSVIKSQNMKDSSGVNRTQRTHGDYQNNTNSCASCHQTHTASSKQLLFKDGVYATCTACHDGTLGFYNVFAKGASASTAGTFGGTSTGNMSVHLATGVMQIKAAPGGNFASVEDEVVVAEGATTSSLWGSEFTCASCHAPHGSYSDRLLHYNPNNVGGATKDEGGYYNPNLTIVDALPAATDTSADFVALRTTPALAGLTGETAEKVVVVNKKIKNSDGTYSYVRDVRPWLYEAEYDAGHVMKRHLTATYDLAVPFQDTRAGKNPWNLPSPQIVGNNANVKMDLKKPDPANPTGPMIAGQDGTPETDVATGVYIKYNKGYAFGTAAKIDALDRVDVAPATVVKLTSATKPWIPVDIDPVAVGVQDFGGVKITTVNTNIYDDSGIGEPITAYCAACHTDYQAQSGALSGVWSKAFRHTTTSSSYTCLKCHFAHGTDVSVMRDAKDNTVATLQTIVNPATPGVNWTKTDAEAYLIDKNKSSALKRYTNMAVCWKCHTSSHNNQFLNNDNYWNNFDFTAAPAVTSDPTKSPAGYSTP